MTRVIYTPLTSVSYQVKGNRCRLVWPNWRKCRFWYEFIIPIWVADCWPV